MHKGLKIFMWIIFGILIFAGVGWITMLLWNWLIPALFHGPVITYWQGFGLLLLSKILLMGFGGGKRHFRGGPPYWRHRMHQKWQSMSPEEREAFRKKVREHWCGPYGEPGAPQEPAK